VSGDVLAEPLEPDGASEALATALHPLGVVATGEIGLWAAGPGTDTDVEVDEVFVVLAGTGTLTIHDDTGHDTGHGTRAGTEVALRPGAVVRLAEGDRTTWHLDERLLKLYVTAEGAPAPAGERLLAADVTTVPLTGESRPGIWVEGGWPTATTELLADIGRVRVAAWEVTTGVVADLEHDEYLLVLSGAGTLRLEGGPAVRLAPHALVRLGEGERTEWTVTETLRALVVSVVG
jgi:uncharacterized cupin superfamily protein